MKRPDFPKNTAWALCTLDTKEGPLACVEVESGLFPLAKVLNSNGLRNIDLFDDWTENARRISDAVPRLNPKDAISEAPRLAPILYPGKVLCAGANYYRHLEEMGVTGATKENQRLFFFFKPPRNAIVGAGATVHMPLDTHAFDWEIELAAVIGKRTRAVSVEDALAHVAGYTIGVDFSARDHNQAPNTFYKLDWVAGKAQETCCPTGPRFVPASAFSDPQAIRLRLSVNGEPKQDDTTGDMIFSLAEQISTLSRIMALDPGDILLTGTPAGVGAAKKTFLNVGDVVVSEIDGIGRLENSIQAPRTT